MTLATEPVHSAPNPPAQDVTVVPMRHPMRWAAIAITVVILLMVARSVATNPRFEWDVVAEYLFDDTILRGLLRTLQLTVVAMALGIVLGVVLAFMRFSHSRFLVTVSWTYTWLFRSVPALVQILFWYNLAALYRGCPSGSRSDRSSPADRPTT